MGFGWLTTSDNWVLDRLGSLAVEKHQELNCLLVRRFILQGILGSVREISKRLHYEVSCLLYQKSFSLVELIVDIAMPLSFWHCLIEAFVHVCLAFINISDLWLLSTCFTCIISKLFAVINPY